MGLGLLCAGVLSKGMGRGAARLLILRSARQKFLKEERKIIFYLHVTRHRLRGGTSAESPARLHRDWRGPGHHRSPILCSTPLQSRRV